MSKRTPDGEGRRTELITLFCLISDDLSGYALAKLMREWGFCDYLPVSDATIYRALARLEKSGLVESREEKNGRYPTARVFRITSAGKDKYRELIRKEGRFAKTPHAWNTFLGLASHLSIEERIKIARQWQEDEKRRIAELDVRMEAPTTFGKSFGEWLLIDHERAILKAESSWIDQYCKWLAEGRG